MSQDLFDYEEWSADCPVEFSGISCSGTSSSPSQSSVPAPVPQAPAVPATPPSTSVQTLFMSLSHSWPLVGMCFIPNPFLISFRGLPAQFAKNFTKLQDTITNI